MNAAPQVTCRECGKRAGFQGLRLDTHPRKRGKGYCDGVRYLVRWDERVEAYVEAGWAPEDAEEAADSDDAQASRTGLRDGGARITCPECGQPVSFLKNVYFHDTIDGVRCSGSGTPVSREDRIEAFEEEGWSHAEALEIVDAADAPSDVWYVHFAFEALRYPSRPLNLAVTWDRGDPPTYGEESALEGILSIVEQLDVVRKGATYWLPLVPADLYLGEEEYGEVDHLAAPNANWGHGDHSDDWDFIYEPELWGCLSGMSEGWEQLEGMGTFPVPIALAQDVSVDVAETWVFAQGDRPEPLLTFGASLEDLESLDVSFLSTSHLRGWLGMLERMRTRAVAFSDGPVRVWWWFVPVAVD